MLKDFVTYDGVSVPAVGLGTWQSAPADCYNAVRWALDAGYRHIDTAHAYGNEADVGRAVRDSGIPREQVFITTKLPSHIKDEKGTERHLTESLRNLGMDYVDLYLIHAPWPWSEIGKDCTEGNIVAWRTMLDLQIRGFIRCCGVSNFLPTDIKPLLDATGTMPAVNQIRYFIGNTQRETTFYCQENGILVEAYSPLATGNILDNDVLAEIAARYNASVAQLCIAYCLHKGTLPLPKSVNKARIEQNLAVDFALSESDVALLDGMDGIGPYRKLRS